MGPFCVLWKTEKDFFFSEMEIFFNMQLIFESLNIAEKLGILLNKKKFIRIPVDFFKQFFAIYSYYDVNQKEREST